MGGREEKREGGKERDTEIDLKRMFAKKIEVIILEEMDFGVLFSVLNFTLVF